MIDLIIGAPLLILLLIMLYDLNKYLDSLIPTDSNDRKNEQDVLAKNKEVDR